MSKLRALVEPLFTSNRSKMPEITEIFWMPLKPGAEDSPAVAELKKSGEALIAQPDLKHSYHGHPIEIEHSVEIVNGKQSNV